MFLSCKHEISCNDFKKGTFTQTVYNENRASQNITRTENIQQSYRVDELGKRINSKNFHSTIEWLNDCDYILKVDASKVEIDNDVDEINRNGGYHFEFLQFDEACSLYKVTLNLDNETVTFTARTCME